LVALVVTIMKKRWLTQQFLGICNFVLFAVWQLTLASTQLFFIRSATSSKLSM